MKTLLERDFMIQKGLLLEMMDFCREQYLVRQDDIREAFAVLEGTIEIVEER